MQYYNNNKATKRSFYKGICDQLLSIALPQISMCFVYRVPATLAYFSRYIFYQATEGKALLLPEEMEMIRTSLLAVGAGGGGGEAAAGNVGGGGGDGYNAELTASAVPEELFRKYTETDSRPLTPAPTLASGPTALTGRAVQEDLPATCNPRERTTLVLDLRASSQNQQVVGVKYRISPDFSSLVGSFFRPLL